MTRPPTPPSEWFLLAFGVLLTIAWVVFLGYLAAAIWGYVS